MIGNRRFLLTLAGILSFTAVMLVNANIDPFNLGLGIGLLLTPQAVSKFGEKYGEKKNVG